MERLKQLVIPLLTWYSENSRDLPWRHTTDPYRVWVSEIMLQQTRVAAVLGYYRRFMEQFPHIPALAQAEWDRLMKAWQGLGYYSRARNLQKAAQIMVERYGGEFPGTYDQIRALPGVGDYTAGAVSSIAFGLPRAAVDGNVLRVVARLNADPSDIALPATRRAVTAGLEAVIPLRAPGTFNQALMELGATVCLPNGAPRCEVCPAQGFCRGYEEGLTQVLPVRGRKKPRRAEERRVYLLYHQDRVALHRRPEGGLLAGLWEFPNTGEGERLPVKVDNLTFAGAARHIFTHIEWHMTAYSGAADPRRCPADWVWATGAQLREVYAVPGAFAPFLDTVLDHLREKEEGFS